MKYNFDKIVNRLGTNSLKYDFAVERKRPENILALWVADMDFKVADEITDSLRQMIEHGIYGYTEPKDSYFEAIHDWMAAYHNWEIEHEWMVKTPGVVYAIAMAIRGLTNEGDSIMLQDPVYYPFHEIIRDNNRKMIVNDLIYKNGKYEIDFEDFEEKIIHHKVKLFLLCSPHNPVGRVWTKDELQRIGNICLKHNVYVVSDEIHQDFTYKGHKHIVYASISSEFANHSIICTAPSKTFNLAGLQVSIIFIPNPSIRKIFIKEIDKTGYSQLNTAGIVACESAYRNGREWLDQLKEYLAGNLEFVRRFLADNLPNIHLIEPEGTYLVWLDCTQLGLNSYQLKKMMIEDAGLWLDDGYIFGENGTGFQRINITCPRSILEQAMKQLKAAIDKLGELAYD